MVKIFLLLFKEHGAAGMTPTKKEILLRHILFVCMYLFNAQYLKYTLKCILL